jgi:hypothetical protein
LELGLKVHRLLLNILLSQNEQTALLTSSIMTVSDWLQLYCWKLTQKQNMLKLKTASQRVCGELI